MNTNPKRQPCSDDLRAFFADYQSWLDEGAPSLPYEGAPSLPYESFGYTGRDRGPWNPMDRYSRYLGLCGNADFYSLAVGKELRELFFELFPYGDREKNPDKIDFVYPFGGELRYSEDRKSGKQHLNQMRNAWVRVNLP